MIETTNKCGERRKKIVKRNATFCFVCFENNDDFEKKNKSRPSYFYETKGVRMWMKIKKRRRDKGKRRERERER